MNYFIYLVLIIEFLNNVRTATIGDGSISLYTGLPIDARSTRGSCEVDGRLIPSETAVPTTLPCHYCICYQGQVSCYWKACGPAPRGCAIMSFENVCNPSLYACKIPTKSKPEPRFSFGDRLPKGLKKKKLIKRRIYREANPLSTLPFIETSPIKFDAEFVINLVESNSRSKRSLNSTSSYEKTCTILGVTYNIGEVIGIATDVCLECRCAGGSMYCSPKCCFLPSPYQILSSDFQYFEQYQEQTLQEPSPAHPLSYVKHQWDRDPFPLANIIF